MINTIMLSLRQTYPLLDVCCNSVPICVFFHYFQNIFVSDDKVLKHSNVNDNTDYWIRFPVIQLDFSCTTALVSTSQKSSNDLTVVGNVQIPSILSSDNFNALISSHVLPHYICPFYPLHFSRDLLPIIAL